MPSSLRISTRGPALLLVALLLSAATCDRSSRAPDEETAPAAASTTGGEFSVYTCEPENLIPSSVIDTCGAQVISSLFRGLVNYEPDDLSATLEDAVAESITTEDDRTFTVKLKEGWTFHNGDPVDAQAFVDSWNFTAYAPNGQRNADFMSRIQGYEEVHPPAPEGETDAPPPTAETMSGLHVVDELTFEVTLSEPFPQWPLTLGYAAFFPMPEEAFADPVAFDRSPIGNGPFMMEGDSDRNERIRLVRYDRYAGSQPSKADAVVYEIYADLDTVYTDLLAGALDITASIPADQLESAKQDLGDRFIERPSSVLRFLAIPMYDEELGHAAGEAGKLRRQALSLAVDRETIADRVFRGTVMPAHGFIPPAVPGARNDACRDTIGYDPDRARELWDEAGGYEGTFTIWFNPDGDHERWLRAVADQWRQALHIEDVRFEELPWDDYLALGDRRGFNGPFRLGWAFRYPSPRDYLEPLYSTRAHPPAGWNYPFYSNEAFDDLIVRGDQQETLDAGIPYYQQAEDILCIDMPAIPVRWELIHGAHSERVTDVTIDAFGHVRAHEVMVIEER